MARKKDKNKVYFGLFIIFLMVSSSIGFMYGGDSSTKKVNGFKFTKTNSGWETYIPQIQDYWAFTYLPNEVDFDFDKIELESSQIKVYAQGGDKSYIDGIKFVLLYKGITVNPVEEVDCSQDMWILESQLSQSSITTEEGCIYVKGNINKFIDGLTYKIFGVI